MIGCDSNYAVFLMPKGVPGYCTTRTSLFSSSTTRKTKKDQFCFAKYTIKEFKDDCGYFDNQEELQKENESYAYKYLFFLSPEVIFAEEFRRIYGGYRIYDEKRSRPWETTNEKLVSKAVRILGEETTPRKHGPQTKQTRRFVF